MTDCVCGCDPARPIPDTAYVAAACADRLARRLREAAELWPALLEAAAGQARMAEPGPRGRGLAPNQPHRPGLGDPRLRHYQDQDTGNPAGLPFSWAAAETRDSVRNTTTTWARLVVDEHGGDPPADTPGLLRWLAGQLGWCRYQRWARDAWDELSDACSLVVPAVDRPAMRVRVAVGPCPEVHCAGQVTALVPARLDIPAVMRCDGCGSEWGAHQWARVGRRIMARMAI